MKLCKVYATLFISWMVLPFLIAQTSPGISSPELSFANNQLEIKYNILNATPQHVFKIWVDITDQNGKALPAISLSGDIGSEVIGGSAKSIQWDLRQDEVILNEQVFVQLNMELVSEPVPTKSLEPQIEMEKGKKAETVEVAKQYSMGTSIFQTLMYPGFGLKQQNKSGAHLLKGVTGYGCLIASLSLNASAESNYNSYLNSFNIEESNIFYDKAIKQDKLADFLLVSGIAIWVADIVWVVLSTQSDNQQTAAKTIDLKTGYTASTHTTSLGLIYNF